MDRIALARAYYEALDGHDYERLASILAAGFVHVRPDMTLEGRDRFVRFMREERPDPDTTHEVENVYRSVEEVGVTGRLYRADGRVLTDFLDVFAFTAPEAGEGDDRSPPPVIRTITTHTLVARGADGAGTAME
jgi:ketosteroid isomerase-like protein